MGGVTHEHLLGAKKNHAGYEVGKSGQGGG